MSWGIIIPEVLINKVAIDNIDNEQESLQEMINYCKERLLILSSATPDTSKEDWMENLHACFNETMDSLLEYSNELYLINIAIESKKELIKF